MGWLIAGRALQGCGAIAGVALALAADHTRAEKRSLVMAMIGMGIGASFLLSIVLSVPLASVIGLRGLFWFTALLGLAGLALMAGIPESRAGGEERLQQEEGTGYIWPLAVSVFLLHGLMTLFFVVLPGVLIERYGLELARHWSVYVPTMLLSAVLIFPLLRWLSARQREQVALGWAFGGLGLAMALFALVFPLVVVLVGALVFFLAFNLLDASMPSLVSRLAGSSGRGRKMGVYTTFQFLGAFAGGACGGWMLDHAGSTGTLWSAALVSLLWALFLQVRKPGRQGRI